MDIYFVSHAFSLLDFILLALLPVQHVTMSTAEPQAWMLLHCAHAKRTDSLG